MSRMVRHRVKRETSTVLGRAGANHDADEGERDEVVKKMKEHSTGGQRKRFTREQLLFCIIFLLGASNSILLYHHYTTIPSSQSSAPSQQLSKPPRREHHPSQPVTSVVEQTNGRVVTVYTHFTPPPHSAFRRFMDSEESHNVLHGVLAWKEAAVSWAWIPEAAFSALLPPSPPLVGFPWWLLKDTTGNNFLYSDRHAPPAPSGHVEELLFRLLSLFHPQPFLQSRYGPRGAVAVVRAIDGPVLDVCFRVHAEYQLNTPPRRSLWFTPAAFLGCLTVSTSDGHVHSLTLHVPTTWTLNLDLEWLIGPEETRDVEVTVTHLPRMSLSTSPGTPDAPVTKHTWSQEVSVEEAYGLLEKEMYRFMQVEYHNFTTAYQLGSELGRPIHVVVAWGALGSQAC